jgi:hypothetical protein
MISQVQLYKNFAEREGNPDKAFEAYTQASNMEAKTGKTPTQLTNEASDLFMEAYPSSSEVVDIFDGWFTTSPNVTMNPATEGQLMLDANSAYIDGYKRYGTAEGAEAYMQSSLENLWGVSQTRRGIAEFEPGAGATTADISVLMRHPPEKYYPAIDEDYGYMYQAISDFAAAGGAQSNGAVLIPDAETDKLVREGSLPTYKVLGVGEFGEAILLPGRFGGEALETQAKDSITADSNATNSLQYVDDFSTELVELKTKLDAAQNVPMEPAALEKLILDVEKAEKKRQAAIEAAVEQGYMSPEAMTEEAPIYVYNLATDFQSRLVGNEALTKRIAGLAKGGDPTDAMIMVIAKELRIPKSVASLVAIELQGMQP